MSNLLLFVGVLLDFLFSGEMCELRSLISLAASAMA